MSPRFVYIYTHWNPIKYHVWHLELIYLKVETLLGVTLEIIRVNIHRAKQKGKKC